MNSILWALMLAWRYDSSSACSSCRSLTLLASVRELIKEEATLSACRTETLSSSSEPFLASAARLRVLLVLPGLCRTQTALHEGAQHTLCDSSAALKGFKPLVAA